MKEKRLKLKNKMESAQQNIPPGSEVRVVSASVIAHLQAQGLQVRAIKKKKQK